MIPRKQVIDWLERFAPLDLGAEWDNVGLLIEGTRDNVQRIMSCLTLSLDVAREAVAENVDLIVTHHPLMFRGVKSITSASPEGQILGMLLQHGVAVYCPHSALDNCSGGINDAICDALKLSGISPLKNTINRGRKVVEGRQGSLSEPHAIATVVERLKANLNLPHLQVVGKENHVVERVAVVCGAGGDFLGTALEQSVDTFITGELRFHDAVRAMDQGAGVIVLGHYGSERHGLEALAKKIKSTFLELDVWASRNERDPLRWW